MDRLTRRLESGEYAAGGHSAEEITAALGRYEDFIESVEAELELIGLNLDELRKAGKQRSATYTMLNGSRYMLEEMQKRLSEPAVEVNARLAAMRRLIDYDPNDDGIRDVEE